MQSLINRSLLKGLETYTPVIDQNKELVEENFEKIDDKGLALLSKGFEASKKTVIFLAGNDGKNAKSLVNMREELSTKYNLAFIDYPKLKNKKRRGYCHGWRKMHGFLWKNHRKNPNFFAPFAPEEC